MVLLDEYKSGGHNINRALLWEYDVDNFDWQNLGATVSRVGTANVPLWEANI